MTRTGRVTLAARKAKRRQYIDVLGEGERRGGSGDPRLVRQRHRHALLAHHRGRVPAV